MIKNNKGFAITEVLILSTVIIGILIFMYSQFKNINRSYQYSFKYDTVEGMYLANNIVNYINSDNYDKLVEETTNRLEGYIDITNCDVELFNTASYCEALFQKSEIDKLIFTEENLTKLRNNMMNFDNDFKKYINQIKTTNEKKDYRIIIKYKDGTYATMRFNKGNSYVEEGLIAHLDGINNTGNGHSIDTTIWKDLSGHGNDATLYNNPTWSNNSLTFDGQTNYGRLENTINMPFPNGASIETRVKVLSLEGNYLPQDGLEFFSNWEGAGIGIKMKSDQVFRAGFFDTQWRAVENTQPSNLKEYYTLVLTYDNSKHNLYINGVLISSDTYNDSNVIKASQAPFGLACNPSSASKMIDSLQNVEFQNVLIYDRALTENEVMRNYEADKARY